MNIKPVALVFLSTMAIGCGSSSSDSKDDSDNDNGGGNNNSQPAVEISLDASSWTDYQYFDLDTMQLVSPEDPAVDTEWDIAFRRTSVILNSGVSGPGEVMGALAVSQDQFYDNEGLPIDSVFINATPDNEGETAFNSNIDLPALSFSADENSNAILGNGDSGWYSYNPSTHVVTINDNNWWVIRSATGDSFVKFHATEFASSGRSLGTLTIGYQLQATDAASFSDIETTITIDLTDGNDACFDFDSNSDVACDSDSWDLRVAPDFTLWLNSDVYGQGDGAIAYGTAFNSEDPDFSQITAGSQVQHWVGDSQAGVFTNNSWYGYNFEERHQIWPNYRVYVVRDSENDDANMYKIQLRSYYNSDRTSGHITLKVADITQPVATE